MTTQCLALDALYHEEEGWIVPSFVPEEVDNKLEKAAGPSKFFPVRWLDNNDAWRLYRAQTQSGRSPAFVDALKCRCSGRPDLPTWLGWTQFPEEGICLVTGEEAELWIERDPNLQLAREPA